MLREVSLISVGILKDYFKKIENNYKGKINFINIKESNKRLESNSILNMINKNKNSLYVLFDLNGTKNLNEINKIKNINKHVYFIIGGSEGVCDEVRNKCNYVIKLSDFTYPHQIFKLITLQFVEKMFLK